MSFTSAQKTAIGARGNVLVVAGAGTGKTSTLVERCLDCLLREKASLDQMLIVTFTDAAATEIRQRIRARLEEQLAARAGRTPLVGTTRPFLTPRTSARCTGSVSN